MKAPDGSGFNALQVAAQIWASKMLHFLFDQGAIGHNILLKRFQGPAASSTCWIFKVDYYG
jgi:predicted lipoprotein